MIVVDEIKEVTDILSINDVIVLYSLITNERRIVLKNKRRFRYF